MNIISLSTKAGIDVYLLNFLIEQETIIIVSVFGVIKAAFKSVSRDKRIGELLKSFPTISQTEGVSFGSVPSSASIREQADAICAGFGGCMQNKLRCNIKNLQYIYIYIDVVCNLISYQIASGATLVSKVAFDCHQVLCVINSRLLFALTTTIREQQQQLKEQNNPHSTWKSCTQCTQPEPLM